MAPAVRLFSRRYRAVVLRSVGVRQTHTGFMAQGLIGRCFHRVRYGRFLGMSATVPAFFRRSGYGNKIDRGDEKPD